MDAAFKVAIPGKHGCDYQLVFRHRIADGFRQGPAVSDAGCAAVPDQAESQRFQGRKQPGLLQIFGHHLGARRQAGLHVRWYLEAAVGGFFGEKACPQHDGGIRGIRAGSDRRDHHRAVFDGSARTVESDAGGT